MSYLNPKEREQIERRAYKAALRELAERRSERERYEAQTAGKRRAYLDAARGVRPEPDEPKPIPAPKTAPQPRLRAQKARPKMATTKTKTKKPTSASAKARAALVALLPEKFRAEPDITRAPLDTLAHIVREHGKAMPAATTRSLPADRARELEIVMGLRDGIARGVQDRGCRQVLGSPPASSKPPVAPAIVERTTRRRGLPPAEERRMREIMGLEAPAVVSNGYRQPIGGAR